MANKNNVRVQLNASLSGNTGATSCIIKDDKKALIPSGAQSTEAQVIGYDATGAVIRRELVNITNRNDNILTLVRTYQACPQSDVAATHTNNALDFYANDWIELTLTAGHIDEIETDIVNLENTIPSLATKVGIQNDSYSAASSATGTSAYAITLSPAVASYTALQRFTFIADVVNSGTTTLNVNGLGAKTIRKMGNQTLADGDIKLGSIVTVVYDGTYMQMISQVGQNPTISVPTITAPYQTGEALAIGDAVVLENIPTSLTYSETTINANALNSWGGTFTDARGYRITANNDVAIYRVTKNGIVTTTRALIKNDAGTVLATATFSGNDAIFSTPYFIASGTTFRIELDNNGSSWQPMRANPTLSTTQLNFLSGSTNATNDATYGWNILSVGVVLVTPAVDVNVGDVGANTRSRSRFIGNGVAITNTDVIVRKVGAPSPAFEVRIETDSAGVPSGTLINANATGTIAAATITTGYFVRRVTFAGSFTVPNGVVAHVVIRQVGDVVNGSNYYQIGGYSLNSTVRSAGRYNGSVWGAAAADVVHYLVLSGMATNLLTKASASYIYKTDIIGYANTAYAVGTTPSLIVGDVADLFSGYGYISQSDMFLSNTPGLISATPGTNRKYVGTMLTNGALHINRKNVDYSLTNLTNNTAYYAVSDGIVVASNTASTSFTLVGYTGISSGAVTDEITRASVAGATGAIVSSISYPVKRGQWFLVNSSVGVGNLKFFTIQ